jgi:hypothetical protein
MSGGYAGKYFKMSANIDMADQDWVPMVSFSGIFDGDGYAIINLTAKGTATYYSEATTTKLGGFCGELNGTIKNVAFLNLYVEATSEEAKETHAGMVAGKSLGSAVYENLFVQGEGRAIGTGATGVRFGTVAGYMDSAPVFKNVACVVDIQGAGSIYRLAGGGGVFTVTDSYIIFAENSLQNNGWVSAIFKPYDAENENGTLNFYCTGVNGDSSICSGNSAMKNLGAEGFYDGKGAITSADFYGSAMGFNAENWLTYTDGAPVQKVFEGKCDEYLHQFAK